MSKRELGKRIALAAGIVLLVALLTVLVIARNGRSERIITEEETARTASTSVEPIHILVAGEDRTSGLHDVLMLVRVDPSTAHVSILQIPRDTYAAYTDGSYRKLNGAAKRLGGMEALCDFLSGAFDVEIQRYVSLDADVLSTVVDAVGGVEITLPEALHYEDPAQGLSIHLPAGKQMLDGKQAEYFVRYRMGYVRGDLGRIDAQKLFLAALAARLRTSFDLWSATRLVATILPHMDTNLSLGEATTLVRTAFAVDDESVVMLTLPGEETVAEQSGASYYALSAPSTAEVLAHYFGSDSTRFDPDRVFYNPRYESFRRIYETPCDYTVYSMGALAKQGIEIEKTDG